MKKNQNRHSAGAMEFLQQFQKGVLVFMLIFSPLVGRCSKIDVGKRQQRQEREVESATLHLIDYSRDDPSILPHSYTTH